MTDQMVQEGCRRLLRAVADQWLRPHGWQFEAIYDEDSIHNFILTATHADSIYKMKVKESFSAEQMMDSGAQKLIERKVERMYRKCRP